MWLCHQVNACIIWVERGPLMKTVFPSVSPHISAAKQATLPAQPLCDQGLWHQNVSLVTIQLNCWADLVVPWRFSLSQRWNNLGTVYLKCLLVPELSYSDCVYPENRGEKLKNKGNIKQNCTVFWSENQNTINKIFFFLCRITFSFCNCSKTIRVWNRKQELKRSTFSWHFFQQILNEKLKPLRIYPLNLFTFDFPRHFNFKKFCKLAILQRNLPILPSSLRFSEWCDSLNHSPSPLVTGDLAVPAASFAQIGPLKDVEVLSLSLWHIFVFYSKSWW